MQSLGSVLRRSIAFTMGKYVPERSKTESGRERPGLALSATAHTVFLLGWEDLGMSLLLCPGKMFRQGN